MLVGGSTGRRRRLGSAGVVGLAVAALALSACSSSTDGSAVATTSVKPPAPAAQVTITAGDQVSPTTPITIKASGGKITNVVVTNTAKGNVVKGDLSADGLTWTTTEPLGYGASYAVVADATNADGKQTEQKSTYTTLTPKDQAYPSLIPAPPGQGQTFGVGQIIGVSFDKNVTDKAAAEKALVVTSTPAQQGSWYWIDAKTVHYRPAEYWQAGTTIKLDANLYGVNLGGGVYGKTDRSVTYTIHDSWIAKADGNTKQMAILHNGAVVNTMPISLGKDSTPTQIGPHVISDKQQQVVMDSATYGVMPGSPGYYKSTEYWDLRISNDGEFVHENPNTVNQQGSSNVSHGCVNLSPENAQWFFNHFNLGDVVEVTNSGGGKLPLWDTYGDWELSWADWQKGSAAKG
ncbi:Ig-like domain-containing protein [Kutzneria sp. 744]|uniref:L,D-transpeptidase n=1 Tax=Kutzneria sp. (strain 744) TaxID=345341 RepID=UPI0003EEE1D3|nr:Ig-like domain-containing protein [Kutzneria sp. 744]EWM15339.1 secreted lipoprotein [Kutzneria sp. 744]